MAIYGLVLVLDIALCIVNSETKELQFSGAKNSLYIFRNDELSELKADRQPIKIYAREKNFINHKFQLQTNDVLFSFSDGFPDQFNDKGKKYMIKCFRMLLKKIANNDLQKQETILENIFTKWKSNA